MKIGVLGYGTVGKSICDLITAKAPGNKMSSKLELKYILRNKGKASEELMTDDLYTILEDEEIELVIDVLPGVHPSYEYISEALRHGKHVISANKAALAYNLPALMQLADEHNAALLYEAACGGAIPIIHEAKKTAATDTILGLYGILNGTSNYILYNMLKNGMSFEDALSNAQKAGYAEADPSADIEGADVRNKAILLAATAWGAAVDTNIDTLGITAISYERLKSFDDRGKAIKLMMLAKKIDKHYKIYVIPVILDKIKLEANVPGSYNIATLRTMNAGALIFYGYGAGGYPTASAILRDASELITELDNGCTPSSLNISFENRLIEDNSLILGTVYIDDQIYEHAAPHDYIETAKANGSFFAFEPDDF